MDDKRKKSFDIDGIEKEYRLGKSTLREMSAQFGISPGMIRKYAKKFDWTRDLSGRIKDKAEQLVLIDAVRKNKTHKNSIQDDGTQGSTQKVSCVLITEDDIIKSAAELQAGALLQESEEIKRLSAIAESFEVEVQQMPVDSNGNPMDLEKRTRILKQLAEVREKVINLRRRNLRINDNSNGDADKNKESLQDFVASITGCVVGVNYGK